MAAEAILKFPSATTSSMWHVHAQLYKQDMYPGYCPKRACAMMFKLVQWKGSMTQTTGREQYLSTEGAALKLIDLNQLAGSLEGGSLRCLSDLHWALCIKLGS